MTFVLLMISACAVNPVTGKKELMLLSKDQEIALGATSHPSVMASFGAYQDEAIQRFISEKGQQMARVSHRPELDYNFEVLDSPVVNAFALPGGYVYFTRGILAHFNNEAEFAGVLGHEIGHVTARHGAQQYSTQILMQGALIGGMILSEDFAQYAGIASQGLGLLMLKFGRDDESQSDRLGVEYSTAIGYDAHEMADFFNTINRLSGGDNGGIPTFLSTHPNPADRFRKVNEYASEWQQKKNVPRSNLEVGRESYLRMIDGLVYGNDPRQGYVENNMFYHPDLKFQFPVPRGWQYQNMASMVQMAPEGGQAVLNFTIAQQKTLDEVDAAFTNNNNAMQILDRQRISVNGMPALAYIVQQTDQQNGQVIRGLIYFIEYGDLIYEFSGLSYAESFNTYRNTFENVMSDFRQLTDQSKINVTPERVRIKTVPRNATLQATLQSFGVPNDRLEELSILNGMELNEQVTRGMLIKVVEK